jgi:hypothetical protein
MNMLEATYIFKSIESGGNIPRGFAKVTLQQAWYAHNLVPGNDGSYQFSMPNEISALVTDKKADQFVSIAQKRRYFTIAIQSDGE